MRYCYNCKACGKIHVFFIDIAAKNVLDDLYYLQIACVDDPYQVDVYSKDEIFFLDPIGGYSLYNIKNVHEILI